MIVEAYGQIGGETERVDSSAILHACVAIEDCPLVLREFGLLLYADNLMKPDEKGNLCIHTLIEKKQHEHVQEVIKLEPKAAAVPNTLGELPLTLILRHMPFIRWNTGIGSLVEAHPGALEETRLCDFVIPLIWCRLSSPSVLFHSIQSRLSIVEGDTKEAETDSASHAY